MGGERRVNGLIDRQLAPTPFVYIVLYTACNIDYLNAMSLETIIGLWLYVLQKCATVEHSFQSKDKYNNQINNYNATFNND